jgi:predicted RNA-binding protein with PUA-like domain
MAQKYWLVKSEPYKYSWDQLVKDGRTYWDGVRNYEARNNLAAMKKGDLTFYYHSNVGKEIVGVARVVAEAYQDPTTEDDRWVVVDVEPVVAFNTPVTLAAIKADEKLSEISLVKRSRLSVGAIEKNDCQYILKLGKTKLPTTATATTAAAQPDGKKR